MTHPTAPLELNKVDNGQLNARQKETYNFHHVAARLSEYGYNCILLSDDWLGADFIAYHNEGERFYRIQLKGRMTVDQKYLGKGIYIAFIEDDLMFVFPHDEVVARILAAGHMDSTASWSDKGKYTWPSVPKWAVSLLREYEVQ